MAKKSARGPGTGAARTGLIPKKVPWLAWAGAGVAAGAVAVGVAFLHVGGVGAANGSGRVHSGSAGTSVPAKAPEAATAVGNGYRIASVTGQALTFPARRPTLLYFMSATCSSCWQGSHRLAQIYPHLRRMAQVISLDVTPQVDTPAQVQQMVQATGVRWPQAFATPAILDRYHVSYLDTVVVLSAAGKVVYDGATPSDHKILALIAAAASGRSA